MRLVLPPRGSFAGPIVYVDQPKQTNIATRMAARRLSGLAEICMYRQAPRVAKTGTLSIDDLRAVQFQSAASFGLNTISEVFARDLQVHSQIAAELVGSLADVSTDRQRIYGGSDRGEMTEVDEFGRAPTRKVKGGTTVAFPMRLFQYAVGWTRKYFQNATVGEVLDQYTAAKAAHMRAITRAIKRAIYQSANYTFNDFLVDKIDLGVKRFVNADGAGIPDGPNGEQYVGATHTHYDAIAGLTAAFAQGAITDVMEHGHGGQLRIVIARADQAAFTALTGFKDYADPRVTLSANAREAQQRLDITRLDNRAIGIFDAAEVWVKPWAIPSYMFTYDTTTSTKPLVLRTRRGNVPALEVAADIDTFPLYAEYMESEFGVGVWTRTNGHVGYFGGGAYTDPAATAF